MKTKYILISLLLVFVFILPIYPSANIVKTDPADIHDPRIKVEITQNQLNYILSVIRKKKWSPLYTFLFGLTKTRKITSIAELKNNGNSIYNPEHVKKEIIVFTANDFDEKNHKGLLYFFKVEGSKLIFDDTATLL